jgi:hypothetical protein
VRGSRSVSRQQLTRVSARSEKFREVADAVPVMTE